MIPTYSNYIFISFYSCFDVDIAETLHFKLQNNLIFSSYMAGQTQNSWNFQKRYIWRTLYKVGHPCRFFVRQIFVRAQIALKPSEIESIGSSGSISAILSKNTPPLCKNTPPLVRNLELSDPGFGLFWGPAAFEKFPVFGSLCSFSKGKTMFKSPKTPKFSCLRRKI